MAVLATYAGRQAGSWCSSPHSIACRRAENGILVAIATHDEPCKRLIEANGTAVRDVGCVNTRDLASHDASTDRGELVASLDLQLDLPSGQKANGCFNQRTVGRDIDDRHFVSWTHARLMNAELRDSPCSCGETTVG
jgi:hypothetical protein